MEGDGGDDDLLLTLLPQQNEEEEEGENPIKNPDHLSSHHQHQQPSEQRHHLRSLDATLITRQLPSRGLSFQLWPAASSLLSLLDRNPASLRLPTSPPNPRILELGSGTGLAGIATAAILGAHVTLTDLPHVLPNLRLNAAANAAVASARGGSVEARALTWGDEGDLADFVRLGYDAVIASDVVYYEELFEGLLRTMRALVKGEVGMVMGHLRRWRKRDGVFFRRARKWFEVEVLHTDSPLMGARVGVVVYRFTAKMKKGEL